MAMTVAEINEMYDAVLDKVLFGRWPWQMTECYTSGVVHGDEEVLRATALFHGYLIAGLTLADLKASP